VRRALPLVAVLAVALAWAAPAEAFQLGGTRWPGRTITFHASAPQYKDAIKVAVSAWNHSGAKIRFKRAPRRRAQLQLIYGHRGGPSGRATLGYRSPGAFVGKLVDGRRYHGAAGCGGRVRTGGKLHTVRCVYGAHVFLDRVGAEQLADPYQRNYMVVTVTHELGHVLGLRHVENTCATMSYQRFDLCPKPPFAWQIRCRPLERDDVRGAVRRYGGRVKALSAPFCDTYAPAPPPTGITARVDRFGRLAVRWTLAAGSVRAYIAIQRDTCATTPMYTVATEYIGAHPAGRYCVTLWGVDAQGRPGPPATVPVTVPAAARAGAAEPPKVGRSG
jgi:hypothetical protein